MGKTGSFYHAHALTNVFIRSFTVHVPELNSAGNVLNNVYNEQTPKKNEQLPTGLPPPPGWAIGEECSNTQEELTRNFAAATIDTTPVRIQFLFFYTTQRCHSRPALVLSSN